MDADKQAILDWFTCAAMEASEGLHDALDDLRRELLNQPPMKERGQT